MKEKILEYERALETTDRSDRVGPGLPKVPGMRFCLGLAGSLKIEMTPDYKSWRGKWRSSYSDTEVKGSSF